ncbi:MAG: hypothetical protein J2P37_35985, partial [Ktedonobacteraceae bacterium]|nr:hypothetical protein [Ktedonobacteraceae bacterium]
PGISQQTPLSDPTPTRRQRRTLLTLLTTTLSFLLLAGTAVSLLYFNGIWPPASANMPTATPVPAASPSSVGQPTVDCPAPGTARKAVMTSINVGKTQNLVFIVNEGTPDNPHAGTIKRRDPVANIGYEMKKMANTYITEGQISQDGHWVLFIARTQGQYQLRLLRVDGQELQTLFCTSGEAKISNAQWSFDMHSIVFNVGSSLQTTYLLDITSGTVQPLLIPDGTDSYIPRAWLDNARLYLTAQTNAPGTIQHNIYLLDLRNGANQSEASLHRVDTNTPMCFDLDDSYDLTQLIMSTCNMPYYSSEFGTAKGPSSITTQPTGGGQPTTIYQNDTMAITTVRAVRPDILLFMVENFDDHQSQNGLWRVGMDGQSLQQLATDSDHTLSLCQFSQFSWSNVSRDGKMFALQGYNPKTREFKLYIGSMDHKGLNPFAGDDELNMPIVGWIQI